MDSLPSLPTDQSVYNTSRLEDKIEDVQEECVAEFGGHEFLPADQIRALLTRENVKEALESSKVAPTEILMDFILHKANRVFLTLFCAQDISAIVDFEARDFHDEHLPLGKKVVGSSANKYRVVGSLDETSNDLQKPWTFFDIWSHSRVNMFLDKQWKFLAPTFGGPKFYQAFHNKRPLPFVKATKGSHRDGHFSSVLQVEIHQAHADQELFRDVLVAVKVFKPGPEDHFRRELETLEIIKKINNQHLISPFAAYENGTNQCFLFPWANGGNLRDYWKKTDDPSSSRIIRDEGLMSWTLAQMRGLCGCLKVLWDNNCRHGDLKPENILHVGGRGNLLIADVGLSKFHTDVTEKRNRSSSMKYGTRRYEAPEVFMDKRHKPLSRDYDIWSMGVLLLEWMIWLLYGNERLVQCNNLVKFWEVSERVYRLDSTAQSLMDEMAQVLRHDTALKHILELIKTRLLVVKLVEENEPLASGRAKASELSGRMDAIVKRAEHEPSYRFDPEIWSRRKGPSKTGATLELPERPRPSNRLLTSTSTSGLDVVDCEEHSGGSFPSITIQHAGNTSSQQLTSRAPDEYNERQSNRLNDAWKSEPDNDFALRVLSQIDWAALRPCFREGRLCDSCKGMDIWSTGFQLPYDLCVLETRSASCQLCKLLYQSLSDNGVETDRAGKLIRSGSTLKRGSGGKSIISIYFDPEPQTSPSPFAQIGFPQLPKPGSPAQLTILREWLRNCDESHKCQPRQAPGSNTVMPTRLIDLGQDPMPSLRLVENTGTINAKYVALSYCWGTIPEGLAFSTYRENIKEHMEGIDSKKLPKTFQDAITVTRGLGIRYLWIDSICIIQKDNEDWEAEAGNMENVFSSAYCTIAASSAKSYLEGFVHDREPRPCATVQQQDSKLYLCKAVDDFHRDVEEGTLNKRGWVLQERALSRRTIHFTSNQVYWECGKGVHCETLAKLRNSKAEFLGDSDFPNSALRYFRDGRIMLFQTLYEMYSKLAFTQPTDRSMGILGLERRLARTFETEGDFGILNRYLQRSLLWKRAGSAKLTPIRYPDGRNVPSWSWMAYSGGIAYVEAPFGGVDWNKDDLKTPFEVGPLRHSTQLRVGKPPPEIVALARDINTSSNPVELRKRITLDEVAVDDLTSLQCVVLGQDKAGTLDERKHYVLVIKPSSLASGAPNTYRRVGVGALLASHISTSPGYLVSIC